MSSVIDQQIVQMKFDNSNFERNAKASMSTLEKLKSALNLKSASSGLEELGAATNALDFSRAIHGAEAFALKFNPLYTMMNTLVQRLTNSMIDMGKNLTVGQVGKGFTKYEEETAAVQTIMAATGKSIDEVSTVLEKLSWFSDETSYSFTDMVNNIGKFTSAGVELENATTSMEGIATWAAISGQNTNTAARAMYNLSQALGTGTVRLQDWMSIENANMATKQFKELTLQIAAAKGALTELGRNEEGVMEYLINGTKGAKVTYQTFRESLSSKWFDKTVLEGVLNEYGAYADAVNSIQEKLDLDTASDTINRLDTIFRSHNFTGTEADYVEIQKALENAVTLEEAKGIYEVYNSIGREAFKAAQEAKTFHDVLDATSDAVSSQWMNIFRDIFGDYQDAKLMWTSLSNELWDVFAGPLSNIRDIVSGSFYHKSQWNDFYNTLENSGVAAKDFEKTLIGILDAQHFNREGKGITELIAKYGSLERVSERGYISLDAYQRALHKLNVDMTAVDDDGNNLFTQNLLAISDAGGRIKLLESITTLYNKFKDTLAEVGVVWDEVFGVKTTEERANSLKSLINRFHDFAENLGFTEEVSENLHKALKGVFEVFKVISDFFKRVFGSVFSKFVEILPSVVSILARILGTIGDILSRIANSKTFNSFADTITSFITNFGKVGNIFEKIDEGLSKFTAFLHGDAVPGMEQEAGALEKVYGIFQKIGEMLNDVLEKLGESFGRMFGEINFGALLNGGIFTILLANVTKFFGGVQKQVNDFNLMDTLKAIPEVFVDQIKSVIETLKGLFGGGGEKTSWTDSLEQVSKALLMLAGALLVLSMIDSKQLWSVTAAMGALMTGLTLMVKSFSGSTFKQMSSMASASGSLIAVTTSLLIASASLVVLSKLSWDQILSSVTALGLVMLEITAFSNSMQGNKKVGGMISLAFGLLVMAGALKVLGSMDISAIGRSVIALGATLLLVSAFLNTLSETKHILTSAAAVLIISNVMILFAAAMKIFGSLNPDQLNTALTAVGVGLAEFAAGAFLMRKSVAGAAAMLIMAAALDVMVPGLLMLANTKPDKLAASLLIMAGAFVILAAAGYALQPVATALLAVGGAMALLGAGVLALGAGIGLLVTTIVGGADLIIATLPLLVDIIMQFIVLLLQRIGEAGYALAYSIMLIAKGILEAINELVPVFVELVLNIIDSVLKSIDEHVWSIVDTAINIAIHFMDALADGIRNKGPDVLRAIGNVIASVIDLFLGMLQSILKDIPLIGSKIDKALSGARDTLEKEFAPEEVAKTGKKAGKAFPEGLNQGLTENMWTLDGALGQLKGKFSNTFDDIQKQSKNSGINVVKGFSEGVNGSGNEAIKGISKFAKGTIGGLNQTYRINSPSKVTEQIGKFFVEGFSRGVSKMSPRVDNQIHDMADNNIHSINDVALQLSNAMEFSDSSQPTIRPVLDLSNIESRTDSMNSLLDESFRYSLPSNLSNTLTNSISVQNGHSDIVNAIDSLKEDFANLRNAISGMNIVMDSGAVVGSISDKMDKSLGEIAMYKGRGIR